MVYVVNLQRVTEPQNIHVRKLNAIVRKLQANPRKIVFKAMKGTPQLDIRTDSDYRRLTGEADDEYKGYGLRGANILRHGIALNGTPAVHLLESICKSHRLIVRSSYAAEMLAAAHSTEDAYPTIITLQELTFGVLTPVELRDLWDQEDCGLLSH